MIEQQFTLSSFQIEQKKISNELIPKFGSEQETVNQHLCSRSFGGGRRWSAVWSRRPPQAAPGDSSSPRTSPISPPPPPSPPPPSPPPPPPPSPLRAAAPTHRRRPEKSRILMQTKRPRRGEGWVTWRVNGRCLVVPPVLPGRRPGSDWPWVGHVLAGGGYWIGDGGWWDVWWRLRHVFVVLSN